MESYNEIDKLFECYDRFIARFRTAHVSRKRDVSSKQELEIRFQHLFRFILGIISQKRKVTWIVNPDIRFRRIELLHDFLPLSTTYFWDVTVEGLELLVDYDVN